MHGRSGLDVLLGAAFLVGVCGGAQPARAEDKPEAKAPEALASGDVSVRLARVKALSARKDRAAIAGLIVAIGDKDLRVSEAAMQALEKMRSPLVVEMLLDALKNKDPSLLHQEGHYREGQRKPDPSDMLLRSLEGAYMVEPLLAGLKHQNPYAQGLCAQMIGRMKTDAKALRALTLVVLKGDSQPVRAIVERIIGTSKHPALADTCVEVFRTDKSSAVRRRVLEMLRRRKSIKVIPLFMEAFKDEDLNVYAHNWIQGFRKAEHIPHLIEGLKHTNAYGRRVVLQVLIYSEDPRARKAFVAYLNDPSTEVRRKAAEGLAALPTPDAVEPLLAQLKSSDKRLRAQAARALGKIGDKRAVPALIAVMQSGDRYDDSRDAAARALGMIGDKRALRPLVAVLSDHRLGDDAAFALGRIGGPKAAKALIPLYKHGLASGLQVTVIEALGRTRQPEALKCLRDALEKSLRERNLWYGSSGRVYGALKEAKDPKLADVLIRAATSKKYKGRDDAVRLLGDLDDPRATKVLVDLLKDPNEELRGTAEFELSSANNRSAVPALIALVKGTDRPARRAAAQLLGAFRDPRAVPALIDALGTKADRPFRLAALLALQRITGQEMEYRLSREADSSAWQAWWRTWWTKNRQAVQKRFDELLQREAAEKRRLQREREREGQER